MSSSLDSFLQALGMSPSDGTTPERTPQWTQQMLDKHKNLNWVQRLVQPNNAGVPAVDLGGGTGASHQMSWTSIGDLGKEKYIVYPNIVQKPGEKKLTWLKGRDAVDYALRSKEYIPVDSPSQADYLSSRYKEAFPEGWFHSPDATYTGPDKPW